MFKLSYSKLQVPYLKISSLGFFLGGGGTIPHNPLGFGPEFFKKNTFAQNSMFLIFLVYAQKFC